MNMVSFLIKRPIAVLMAFLGLVILGCVTFVTLPVSLLPDVAIPHISVRVSGGNMSAREVENTVTSPLRRELMQVSGLSEIKSETRDGTGVIHLTMDYGVDTDLAFIEVNEKIDAAMNSLPRDVERPQAVKSSASDIPVTYLQLTTDGDEVSFYDVADNIIRRRLEQLPEVSMVDITGVPGKELRITPNYDKMRSAGITINEIENALNENNAEPGSMTVRDGYYEYNIHISNRLRTPEDVKHVPLMKNGRMHTLGDFCEVRLVESKAQGYSLFNGKRAVTMAVIKHEKAGMGDLDKAIDGTVNYFAGQYPDIKIVKTRNQTELLDFTISNLCQNLVLGLILVFLVCALFMRSVRLPLVVGFTVIVAVIVTFLLFYLFRISINIISLAGLILAIGMMIDNSVIVAENITQFRARGHSLFDSCVKGTTEMITPMLSSSLTTVAVFVPLVFMSGIAGAIFADQAFSITAGLASSYIVGITLLPVLYYVFASKKEMTVKSNEGTHPDKLTRIYDKGIDFVFAHKGTTMLMAVVTLISLWPLFKALDTERLPQIDSAETILAIDWNENINIDESRRRGEELVSALPAEGVSHIEEHSAFIGRQGFMLGESGEQETTCSELYLRIADPAGLEPLKESIANVMRENYPAAVYEFKVPANPFEQVFSTTEAPLEARFLGVGSDESGVLTAARIRSAIEGETGIEVKDIPRQMQVEIIMDPERMLLYGVNQSEVRKLITTAFEGNNTAVLRSYQDYIPVRISDFGENADKLLQTTLVSGAKGKDGNTSEIPFSALTKVSQNETLKTIHSSAAGEYLPVEMDVDADNVEGIMQTIKRIADGEHISDVVFSGSIFSNRKMMEELTVILLVSLLMMYFILCAQFESFMQPLIVLVEIPLDIAFALLTLLICGETLNLMSAIGIIVTCGIVVNDSILKLDSINELRKKGMPLMDAIHTAGRRRLKPILMTSLTTIFAMVPVLFTSDMGSELQRPLAIAMIGSMTVGTLVSIFVIPLLYYMIYRKK